MRCQDVKARTKVGDQDDVRDGDDGHDDDDEDHGDDVNNSMMKICKDAQCHSIIDIIIPSSTSISASSS